MYIGSPGGGVWRTRDGGHVWTPLFDRMPSMAIGALALDPLHPATIFAGTGNDGAYAGYMGVGLYRSHDEGNHWSRVGGSQFEGCAFDALKIYPTEDQLMVAAVSVDPMYSGPATPCLGGVYLSTDGGTTWNRWLARSRVDDVTFGQARLLPVGVSDTGLTNALAIEVFAGVHGEGLYRASVLLTAGGGDSPGTWQQVAGGLPTSGMSEVKVAVAPSNPARAYVIMGNPEPGPLTLLGGWTTADDGQSWTSFDSPPGNWAGMALTVDPYESSRLYFGSAFIYRVDGAGATVVPLSQGDKAHMDVRAMTFDSLHRLYVGTDGGLVRTSDDESFESVNGNLSIAQVNPGLAGTLQGNGAVVPGGPFLAGLIDNGTVQYNGTQVWHEVFSGDGSFSAVDPAHPDTEYVTVQSLGLYKALDGATFTFAGDPRWGTESRAFFAPFVMDLARPDRLYAGTEKVYRSTDAAGSWQIISPDFHSLLTAIAPASSDPQVVYAGTRGAGIETTADGGGNWTQGAGLPDRAVNDLAVNPGTASEAWAALGGFGAGHLFHTTDTGQTWTDASGDLPDAPVNAVAVDNRYSPPVLFVGTDVGVFISTRWRLAVAGIRRTARLARDGSPAEHRREPARGRHVRPRHLGRPRARAATLQASIGHRPAQADLPRPASLTPRTPATRDWGGSRPQSLVPPARPARLAYRLPPIA